MDTLVRQAAQTLRSRFRVVDPDVIADTLAHYWYQLAIKGYRPGYTLLRWSLIAARNGRPFPGTGTSQGRRDAMNSVRGNRLDSVACRRFLPPARAAAINEEVGLVKSEARTQAERVAITGLLLEQTDVEASEGTGLHRMTICEARKALSKRCRARLARLK
jgi:hypothetical protein